MAVYPAQNPTHAGLQIAFTSPPANGDIASTVADFLLVVNPTANGTITVSLPLPASDGVTARWPGPGWYQSRRRRPG